MHCRRTLVLALALTLAPAVGAAQSAPPPQAPLTPTEQAFYTRIAASLPKLYPNPAAAEKAGYFRYTNEDKTGAISYENTKYFDSPDPEHPQQLWYDVQGRLLGADESQTAASSPNGPTAFGLGASRFHHIPLHIHFGLKQPDGSIKYGLFTRAADFTAAGLDPLHPTAADLVKLGKATSPAQVAFVFPLRENWDAQIWVIPNPDGQFADANPNVKPSATQGGGAGETRM